MTTTQDHYENLLARFYTWMFGAPFEQKVEEQTALLAEAGVTAPDVAVDLGCGSGFQSVGLARLGASRVHAFDNSAALLAELRDHAGSAPITTYEEDLTEFCKFVKEPADTIVCMGDTLTHLASPAQVASVLRDAADRLCKGGRLVLSWRDLSTPPVDLGRFIPLRSTDDRIMVCFLEDCGDGVLVHDLIHVREQGEWRMLKSAYRKLKLSSEWVRDQLAAVGLQARFERTVRGMTVLAAEQ